MELFSTNVEKYWEKVGDDYNISFEEFQKICNTPFSFVKEVMSSGILKDIRYKYFGIFEVSKSRVDFSMKSIEKNYQKGAISKKIYDKRMQILNNYD